MWPSLINCDSQCHDLRVMPWGCYCLLLPLTSTIILKATSLLSRHLLVSGSLPGDTILTCCASSMRPQMLPRVTACSGAFMASSALKCKRIAEWEQRAITRVAAVSKAFHEPGVAASGTRFEPVNFPGDFAAQRLRLAALCAGCAGAAAAWLRASLNSHYELY